MHSERVLAVLISELLHHRMIGVDGAAMLEAIANPDSLWGNKPPDLRTAIQQAIRPRVFAKDKAMDALKEALAK